MIVDAIVAVVFAILDWLVGLLPNAGDLGLSSSSGWFVGYGFVNQFVPADSIVAAVLVILGVHLAVAGVQLVLRVYQLLPFKFS